MSTAQEGRKCVNLPSIDVGNRESSSAIFSAGFKKDSRILEYRSNRLCGSCSCSSILDSYHITEQFREKEKVVREASLKLTPRTSHKQFCLVNL